MLTVVVLFQEYGMWLHANGDYGDNSFICPELRGPMKEIQASWHQAPSLRLFPFPSSSSPSSLSGSVYLCTINVVVIN